MPSESEEKIKADRRIAFLDYLRIFAFTTVIAGHKFVLYFLDFVRDPATRPSARYFVDWMIQFIWGGGAGVIVFFMVSGYIITHVLTTEAPTEFLIKRFFRIFPLYWFAVITETILAGHVPKTRRLITQLLLIGDFYPAAYSCGGVEWTLRIEVLFYLIMILLKLGGFLNDKRRFLPLAFIAVSVLLMLASPIPSNARLERGYVDSFMPFLFLGGYFYLFERAEIRLRVLIAFMVFVFVNYLAVTEQYHSQWIASHFAVLGVLTFTVAWINRARLRAIPLVILFSDLTYSTYLFHNWTWIPIKTALAMIPIPFISPDIQTLIVLLVLCYILNRTIERWGIKAGRMLTKNRRKP